MRTSSRSNSLVIATVALVSLFPVCVSAQFVTGFEPPNYVTGSLSGQEAWTGGPNAPRVETAAQIAGELEAAGLNPANPIHSGKQGLLMTYTPGESSGGFLRRQFYGLDFDANVVMNVWARPLTPGSDGSTIGFNQGNTFVGLMDDIETRALAFRFGVVRDGSTIVGTTIDYASATVGDAVWVPSGLTWEADTWYNFRFEADYISRQYDFYVNNVKVNSDPILFYNTASTHASKVFISRGTNQAGMLLDDISVISASAVLEGDFNKDGVVDAADYTVWRDGLGTEFQQSDFTRWKQNFGATLTPAGASAAVAVPEPAAFSLLSLALVFAAMTRRSAGGGRQGIPRADFRG